MAIRLGHVVTIIALFLVTALPAFAEIPLSDILQSMAGRYIFGEIPRGAEVASRIIGSEVGVADRNAYLMLALRQPEMSSLSEEVTARLNRVHERFAREFPQAADEVFAVGSRALTAQEAEALQRIVMQELDSGFVEFIPRRAPGMPPVNFAEAREAFLNPTARPASPEVALRGWVATPSLGIESQPAGILANRVNAAAAFTLYENLRAAGPEVARLLPKAAIYELLANEENMAFTAKLKDALTRAAADTAEAAAGDKLKSALRAMLEGKVPASTIDARIQGLQEGSTHALKRALGDMDLHEVQLLVHGGNPLAPTADSLLGKYMSETGAASVVRTFPRGPAAGPGSTTRQGAERLVVAVSAESMPAFLKYFSNENLLGHLHTPQQGTLNLAFQGKAGTYGRIQGELRFPREGTIMPEVLLKTSEGQRVAQFVELASGQSGQTALQPWMNANYCATGGYNSCTHWFGNIPIGDRLVTEYKFPGMIDNYANNQVPPTPEPRIQPLRPYDSADPLVRRVWKFPGNEQLADTLGLQPQNLSGRLANPGWVAHTLTGVASVDRVPVVFYFVADARAAIAPTFDLQISAH